MEVTAARQKITSSLEPLIVGVSRVIDFYDSRNSDTPIERTYVTGLGGSFSGMSKLFTNCLERKVHTLSEMDDKIGMSKAIRSTRPAAYISCLGAVLAPVGLIDKSTSRRRKGTDGSQRYELHLRQCGDPGAGRDPVHRHGSDFPDQILRHRGGECGICRRELRNYSPRRQYIMNISQRQHSMINTNICMQYTENPNENLVEFINELEQILPR